MTYIVTKSPKSYGIAILLILILGPIGLFYSSVLGGIIMTFIVPIGVFFGIISGTIPTYNTGILIFGGIILYYILLFMWSLTAVSNYNDSLHANSYAWKKVEENMPSDYNYYRNYEKRNRSGAFYYFLILIMALALAFGLYKIFKSKANNQKSENYTQMNTTKE